MAPGRRSPYSCRCVASAVPVDHEVGDERQCLAVLGLRKGRQRLLGRLRIGVSALQCIRDALVPEDEATDLLDLRGMERPALQQPLDVLSLRPIRALERGDEGQRSLSLAQIGPDRLAESGLVGDEVKGVIADLKRDADVEPVARETVDALRVETAEQTADPAARRHERGSLLGDDPHVVRLARRPAALALELKHLGLGHRHGGPREGLEHAPVALLDHQGERFRVQVLADEDRPVRSPPRIGGGPPASKRGLIHHVVVDQRRRVQELDDTAHAHRAGTPIPGQPRGHEQQDRPQALASGSCDELAHLVDERHRGVYLGADGFLEGPKISPDRQRDAILEQRFERGGGGHADDGTAAQRTTTRSSPLTCAPDGRLSIATTENLSRTSTTLPDATSSSSSPKSSPVTGCTIVILSRRRLTVLPSLTPSAAARSMTTRVVSTYTTKPRVGAGVGGTGRPASLRTDVAAAATGALDGVASGAKLSSL